MLFLAWLAVSFLAVLAINLYLRYFGLPRRPLTSPVDGRAYYGAPVAGTAGYATSSTGALGSNVGGGWTAALFGGSGYGSSTGETVCGDFLYRSMVMRYTEYTSHKRAK